MRLIKPAYKTLSDEDLYVAMTKGDKRAFNELYDRYSGQLQGYFMRMLWRDKEKAEDFVHDIFAKVIRKPELFDTSRKFKSWVYSVANNMCKNEYKKHEVRKNVSSGLDGYYSLSDSNSNVMNEVHESQFSNEFQQCLNELADKHKEVFALRHLEGLSIKEISEMTEISEGTVKSRLFYATKYLANSLQDFNPVLNR